MTWHPAPSAPPMGWYPTRRDDLRWWDGRNWTGMRARGGRIGIDWFATDQPSVSLALGFVFLALGFAQMGIGYGLSSPVGGGVLLLSPGAWMLAASVLWFAIAGRGFSVRRLAPPASSPAFPDAARPLPGEQEGHAAGWYPVASQVGRWWTGVRWAPYIWTRSGVRPTFHGVRSYRIYRGMTWSLLAIGVVAVPVGISMLVALTGAVWGSVGTLMIVIGAAVVLVGVLLLALSPLQRRVLLLPESPPSML